MYEIFIPEMRLAVARFSSFVSSFFFLFYFFSSSRVLGEIRREKRYELAPLDAFIVGWGPDYARKLKPSSIYASIVETLRPFRVTLYVCCFFFFSSPFTYSTMGSPEGFHDNANSWRWSTFSSTCDRYQPIIPDFKRNFCMADRSQRIIKITRYTEWFDGIQDFGV